MSSTVQGELDGEGVRVALVVSRFNERVTEKLREGAEECLAQHGAGEAHTLVRVPGAWELPLAVQQLARRGGVDAIVALGAVIRGETPHFDYICEQVARGLGQISIDSGIPVTFGVLTTETGEQALKRAGGAKGNKGWDATLAALEMANLYRALSAGR